ncbi:hypothetical protein GWK47_017680 [Chionoecetes opilio]|uniref:Uncharacterized protein n=1 Tax=Chionoecetes opilio TaxID=41210 RepID=A0A8J4XVP2_CHIOP|nr:hypothetical protein GWK47_017680 [Chionoecetes opilio]
MMQFVRAEREGDWPLHLAVVSAMMPYFFASAHFNYARYGLYYLRSMEAMPAEVLPECMRGNHVMRHNPGIWNGIWSDMFIESTFMRYGHEAGGLVGLTLQPSAVSRWALSLHVCSQLRVDLPALKDGQTNGSTTTHKEETNSRMKSDATDREKLKTTLSNFIDPLDTSSHPEGIVNIATGLVSPSNVNIDRALQIGRQQMNKFESRDLDIKEVLTYELSATPPALFDENGDMRSQNKAMLKTKLQVQVSNRHIENPDGILIDGCALLWVIHWPSKGTVEDLTKNFMRSLHFYLQQCRVHLSHLR